MIRAMAMAMAMAAALAALQDSQDCDLKAIQVELFCPSCETLIEPVKKEGDIPCAKCKTKLEKVEVCVKSYYVAACCRTKHAGPGECCGRPLVKKVSRARVVFACQECGQEGREGASCTRRKCPDRGKPLPRRCTKNGEYPHGGEA